MAEDLKLGEIGHLAAEADEQRLRYKQLEKFDTDTRRDTDEDGFEQAFAALQANIFPLELSQTQREPGEQEKEWSFAERNEMFEIAVKERRHDHQLHQEKPAARCGRHSGCEWQGVHEALYEEPLEKVSRLPSCCR